jgi:hypothetical protein
MSRQPRRQPCAQRDARARRGEAKRGSDRVRQGRFVRTRVGPPEVRPCLMGRGSQPATASERRLVAPARRLERMPTRVEDEAGRCEAGAAERRCCSDPRPRGGAGKGTCKKKAQRDRRQPRAQGRLPCRIFFSRHTAWTRSGPKRPCLRDMIAFRGRRLAHRIRVGIGSGFGDLRGYRQRNGPHCGARTSFRIRPRSRPRDTSSRASRHNPPVTLGSPPLGLTRSLVPDTARIPRSAEPQ